MGGGIATALLVASLIWLSLWRAAPTVQSRSLISHDQQITVDQPPALPTGGDAASPPLPIVQPRGTFGLHDTPIIGGSRNLDQAFKDWEALNVSWVTVLDPRDALLDRANRAGIVVVARVYSRSIFEQGDLAGVTQRMVKYGMRYVVPYNEPNLRGECDGRNPDPVDFAHRWLIAAEIIHAAGGYPVLTPLAPQGDYPDVEYLRKMLSEIVASRGAQWLTDYHVAVGVHSYIMRPGEDYLARFRSYDAVVRSIVGHSLPMLGTEGGVVVGPQDPAMTPDLAITTTIKIVDQLNQPGLPSYILGGMLWLYSNEAQGGLDPKFEQSAWYQTTGPGTIYQDVQRRYGPKLDPLSSSGLLLNMGP